MKRGRPGSPSVRKGKAVGPDYPEEYFRNPPNAGIDEEYGSTETKTLDSPTSTPAGMDIEKNPDSSYDDYWGHGAQKGRAK